MQLYRKKLRCSCNFFRELPPSNRIVVTIETAVAIEDELNIIVCKKKGKR